MEGAIQDLAEEHQWLDSIIGALPDSDWDALTPAEPWTVRDQISHLAFFDEMAELSARDPDRFTHEVGAALIDGLEPYIQLAIDKGRGLSTSGVLEWWRDARIELLGRMHRTDADLRLPWYGPPMRAESSVTARLMETWAHGQDICDALGVERQPTARLFRIAELGVKTFRFSFENRGLPAPGGKVAVTLTGPGGSVRTWNSDFSSAASITGPVEDFCLVVAQRRNITDTAIEIEGGLARQWMTVAQVFAGPPGPGRKAKADR